jgi:L-asparaginase
MSHAAKLANARPRVDYLALGGTIAGASPTLTAQDIMNSVPGLGETADVRSAQFLQTPSPALTFGDLIRLHEDMRTRVQAGAQGIVLTQGTDTVEEVAFALDLLWDLDAPVIITGAMRNPSLPGADGPANLFSAVQVAASRAARGLGALVVLNDEIHAARFVHKAHTSSPSAFRSNVTGPIGWLSEGRVVIAARPVDRSHLTLKRGIEVPPVALIGLALGDDARLLQSLIELGYRGLVIEAFGGGHVAPATLPYIKELSKRMPIVLASRTGNGEVLSHTYRFPGSEIELLGMGLIRAGALDGLKARILLSFCLAEKRSNAQIAEAFAMFGMTSGPVISPKHASAGRAA